MSEKQVRAQYTREFKREAVRQVRAGQAIAVVAKVLGIPKASLGNWVRLSAKGELDGAGSADRVAKVSPEHMERNQGCFRCVPWSCQCDLRDFDPIRRPPARPRG